MTTFDFTIDFSTPEIDDLSDADDIDFGSTDDDQDDFMAMVQARSAAASNLLAAAANRLYENEPAKISKSYEWEKPSWAKENKLKKTEKGQAVKKGVDLQGPITQAPHLKDSKSSIPQQEPKKKLKHKAPASPSKTSKIEWEKPDWTKKPKLKKTEKGQAVKKGADLQRPITQAPHLKKQSTTTTNSEPQSPRKRLKPKAGITQHASSTSPTKSKNIEWEKPEWTKAPKLKKTKAGEQVKKGKDLQGPITMATQKSKDASATKASSEAPAYALKRKSGSKSAPTTPNNTKKSGNSDSNYASISTMPDVMDLIMESIDDTLRQVPLTPKKGTSSGNNNSNNAATTKISVKVHNKRPKRDDELENNTPTNNSNKQKKVTQAEVLDFLKNKAVLKPKSSVATTKLSNKPKPPASSLQPPKSPGRVRHV